MHGPFDFLRKLWKPKIAFENDPDFHAPELRLIIRV